MTAMASPPRSPITARTPVSCCGESHLTPYCPNCGRKLASADPMVELATMLRRKISSFREKIDNPLTKRGNTDLTADQIEKSVSRSRSELAKYQAWLKSLLIATGVSEADAEAQSTASPDGDGGDDDDDI